MFYREEEELLKQLLAEQIEVEIPSSACRQKVAAKEVL